MKEIDLIQIYAILSIVEIETTLLHSLTPSVEVELRMFEASIDKALTCLRDILKNRINMEEI